MSIEGNAFKIREDGIVEMMGPVRAVEIDLANEMIVGSARTGHCFSTEQGEVRSW
jgi:hypothetical protein